jgi:hypothetical protein
VGPGLRRLKIGSAWLPLLTAEQTHEAVERGLLRNISAGHDPDAPEPVVEDNSFNAARARGEL